MPTAQIIRSLIQAAGKRMVTKPSLGYSSRAWGFTLDTIVGLDVVLANGTFVQATPTAYKDIFWVGISFLSFLTRMLISLIGSQRCSR